MTCRYYLFGNFACTSRLKEKWMENHNLITCRHVVDCNGDVGSGGVDGCEVRKK